MSDTFLTHLNEKQKLAVALVNGSSIILAGAGSGKTRVLVYKVLNLIAHGVPPQAIVMITFTNKAAVEMKTRIQGLLKDKKARLGYIGTFHSFCAQILRRDGHHIGIDQNFVIYDDEDELALLKSILKKKGWKLTPSYVSYRISAAKNHLITPQKYLDLFADFNASSVSEIYDTYENMMRKNNALDFDDLLMKANELFTMKPAVLEKYWRKYSHILVDEFQDTNVAQYELTKKLASSLHNLTVVGDFSQSIYSWRGADIRNLERVKEDFPKVKMYYLEENYRSTQTILDFAYKVISRNETHPILELQTRNPRGEEITFFEADNEEEEAMFIARQIEEKRVKGDYSDFAVLYRTNAQSRVIEEAFLTRSIPYVLVGGIRFYGRKEIKDVLSYLRLIVNPKDDMAKERLIKLGKTRWKAFAALYHELQARAKTLTTAEIMERILVKTGYLTLYNPDDPEDYAKLENIKELKSVALNFPDLTQFLEQVALVESEYFEGEKKNRDGVRLMTLHQAKGLEFPTVFIVGLEEGILPHARSLDDLFELEEERRLFYVGITRARQRLYITFTKRRFIFGRRGEAMRSRFIEDTAE